MPSPIVSEKSAVVKMNNDLTIGKNHKTANTDKGKKIKKYKSDFSQFFLFRECSKDEMSR
jgi:hypothetical protein